MPRSRATRWVAQVALVLAALLCAAGAASAQERGRYNAHCARITRQIGHYQDVRQTARSRGNDLWEQSTEAQIERLSDRRDRLCPAYAESVAMARTRAAAKETAEFMKFAAKAAVTFFTFGLY